MEWYDHIVTYTRVKGANPERNGVVSRSHNTEPAEQDGPRNVANGLFVSVEQK
jgi:hypothetical protein